MVLLVMWTLAGFSSSISDVKISVTLFQVRNAELADGLHQRPRDGFDLNLIP